MHLRMTTLSRRMSCLRSFRRRESFPCGRAVAFRCRIFSRCFLFSMRCSVRWASSCEKLQFSPLRQVWPRLNFLQRTEKDGLSEDSFFFVARFLFSSLCSPPWRFLDFASMLARVGKFLFLSSIQVLISSGLVPKFLPMRYFGASSSIASVFFAFLKRFLLVFVSLFRVWLLL